MTPFCLIDCDPMKYAAGFGCESRDENGLIVVKPIEHGKWFINSMVKKCIQRCESREYQCFVTPMHDKSNFRFDIFPDYKANRKDTRKPYHINALHEHLVTRWRAKESAGEEADDTVSIAHCALNPFGFDFKGADIIPLEYSSSIICSIDKDFNNVPGWHYNPRKDEFYFVSEIDALRNFYLQILTGDATDNIPRIKKGWRQKSAEEKIQKACTEKEMYDIVYEVVYTIIYGGDESDKTRSLTNQQVDSEIKEFVLRNGRLVWLRRKENEMWELPVRLEEQRNGK